MAGAGCPLAILAVALRHPDRLGTDRVFDGPAEALASSKRFARHGSPPSPASAVRVGNAVRATQFGAYDPGSLRGSRRRPGSHTRSGLQIHSASFRGGAPRRRAEPALDII